MVQTILSGDLQAILSAAVKTSDLAGAIAKIKAHAGGPEAADGYGSDFDKP